MKRSKIVVVDHNTESDEGRYLHLLVDDDALDNWQITYDKRPPVSVVGGAVTRSFFDRRSLTEDEFIALLLIGDKIIE